MKPVYELDEDHHFSVPETVDEQAVLKIRNLFELPLLTLINDAAAMTRAHWNPSDIEKCSLLSVKTGQCSEDCAYCSQSSSNDTGITTQPLINVDEILEQARAAKAAGAQRFCMSAAWRKPPSGEHFARMLLAITEVKKMGLETCATLGLLNDEDAEALKTAGLDVYNHNLDTSPEYYEKIVTSHTFTDRLNTIRSVRRAGMRICSGGIVGMGEERIDRIRLIAFLSSMNPQPENLPINLLVKIPGTRLAHVADLDILELVRTIAVARITLPNTRIRLAAGRCELSREAQTLCFAAGANSLFIGEKLLTTPLPGDDFDAQLLRDLTQPSPHL